MSTPRHRRGVAVGVAALTAAATLPFVLAPAGADATAPDRRGPDRSGVVHLRPAGTERSSVGLTEELISHTRRGVCYRASVWVKATPESARGRVLPVRVTVGERTESGIGVRSWKVAHLQSSGWQQVAVPFTARHSGRSVDVAVHAGGLQPGAELLVADVRVRQVRSTPDLHRGRRGVHFGASVDEGPHQSWAQAVHLSDRRYTKMEVIRVYEPMIRNTWSGVLDGMRRPVNVSFTAPPSRVLAGDYDRTLRQWFHDAPNRVPIWWTYWHEPEDDIARGALSADSYRRAWRHIQAIARRSGTPNLHPTLVLMAWTAQPASGRRIRSYYPGDFIDVIGWDGYNTKGTGRYKAPHQIFGPAVRKSHHLGARFAISELGSLRVPGDDGSRRAHWLRRIARFAGDKDAAYVAYWDAQTPNGDWRLTDLPSRRAWRAVVKG